MIDVCRYNTDWRTAWDDFVRRSKNGTFLFLRDYMDYHADRFTDHSLLFFREGRLYALLPACEMGEAFISHAGLTYGGLVMDERVTTAQTLELFGAMNDYLATAGFRTVRYKCVPWIYHRLPAEEDLYALFRIGARLVARDIGSVVVPARPVAWKTLRKRGAKRAEREGLRVRRSDDFAAFWKVLSENLQRKYDVSPVHTLEEITLLHSRFPEEIQLYTACRDDEVLGGVVLYVMAETVHAQYISATESGKRLGAIDALFKVIIERDFCGKRFIDFGRSTEQCGRYLNEALIYQKEGFGGRGVCWDWYEWDVPEKK